MQFGKTRILEITPAISTSAYTAGDAVGAANVLSMNGTVSRRGVLKSLVVTDSANQKQPLTILVMKAAIAAPAADNAAFAIAKADLPNVVAKINVLAADYETVGGKAVANITLSQTVEGENTVTPPFRLWVYILTTGTPTYATTSDLFLSLGLLAD